MNWRSTVLPHVVLVGLAWLSKGFAPLASFANEIDRISVIPDGSADPPGIRMDVMASLDPEAKDAHLEVFAFLVTRTPDGTIPIAAMSERNADDKGNLRIKSSLRVKGESIAPLQIKALEPRSPADFETSRVASFRRSLVIPYADIKLPPGKHQVGYEVHLIVNDELEEIRPSRLTMFQVGHEAREEWQLAASRIESRSLTMEVRGRRWYAGALQNIDFNIESIYSVEVPYTILCSEKISRGFKPDALDPNPAPLVSSKDYVPLPKRTILFATNRNEVDAGSDPSKRFGDESEVATDQMHYGSCVTSIPINVVRREPGTLNQPGPWGYFWKETPDPNKHFLILDSNLDLEASDFAKALSKDDILVFVHGYNNTFPDSILRAAQLQHDLKFPGKVVAFSWPSSGKTLLRFADPYDDSQPAVRLAYQHDEEQAALSAPFLAHLLGQLLDEPSPVSRKVHVLAHSMGNRVLLHALHLLQDQRQRAEKKEKEPAMLGEVLMAAADVFGADYSNWRGALSQSCARVTFYFSANDAALKLSQLRHLNKPIGLEAFFDSKKMDTISADKLTSMFNRLGHNYVMESKPLLNDIRLVIRYGHTPLNRRPPLSSRIESPMAFGNFFWTFGPYR